jgi:hypothetical protein
MKESRTGIGQHRVIGRDAAPNNGQKNLAGTPGDIGQIGGGEQHQGVVPAGRRDSAVSTTIKSAGPLTHGERRGADDRRR